MGVPFEEIVALVPDHATGPVSAAETMSPLERAVLAVLSSVLPPDDAVQHAVEIGKLISRERSSERVETILRKRYPRLVRNAVFPSLVRLLRWLSRDPEEQQALLESAASVDDIAHTCKLSPHACARLLLFVSRKTLLPLDRPIARVLVRHGWLDWPPADDCPYRDVTGLSWRDCLKLYHALRWIARTYCPAKEPKCAACPLQPLLPPTGPYEPDVE